MALRKRGKYLYGDSQADIRDELVRVGKLNEYVPTRFADARCVCGGQTFRLRLDEGTAAVRVCPKPNCAQSHPIGDSDLLHVPIGLKAGFGELGRHGSIIHPTLGPLFRMGSVALTLDLAIDHPIDAGIAKFCDTCRACRKYCPAHAIPDQRTPSAGKDHLGNDRYVVDTGRCFPYFAKHYYCSICLPVCVYNHKEWARDFEGFTTKLFPQVVMEEPPAPVDPDPARRHQYLKLNRL